MTRPCVGKLLWNGRMGQGSWKSSHDEYADKERISTSRNERSACSIITSSLTQQRWTKTESSRRFCIAALRIAECRSKSAMNNNTGGQKAALHSGDHSAARAGDSRPNGKELKQEGPRVVARYFTWLASSHLMAARSKSVKEVTPNFSFARAQ